MIKYVFLLASFYTTGLCAQTVQPAVALSHYVLDSFTKGKVLLKSGAVTQQILNYNILTGEMIFDAGGRYLAIAEPQNVDTVYLQNRAFIPAEKKFFEVLTKTPVPLLLEYTYTVQEPGASAGYGSTTTTTATAALRSLITAGGAYPLKLPDAFQIKVGYSYWILKEGNLRKANNVQQLINMFPAKKRVLADWAKAERTSFSRPNDVIRLVQQLER